MSALPLGQAYDNAVDVSALCRKRKSQRDPLPGWLKSLLALTMDVVFELINRELLITDDGFDKIAD
jgi:hypothetical protein